MSTDFEATILDYVTGGLCIVCVIFLCYAFTLIVNLVNREKDNQTQIAIPETYYDKEGNLYELDDSKDSYILIKEEN